MKLHIPVYSCALLLSAILVFTVQPMFTKMVLPLLGGTPQVWNTSMLFFQICLLGGYAYAHATTRFFSVRLQAFTHIILLSVFVIILPFAIPQSMYPSDGDNPTIWQLSTMLVVLGGPFLIISASAPMLQRWFTVSNHESASNPYFLYGASNIGSMGALLLYPVLIEPSLTIPQQTDFWKIGYIALIGFSILCAALVWNSTETKQEDTPSEKDTITPLRRLKWLILAFVPASLMLGVTTYITTDIASVPLLWVLPLALYMGTFIIVFARKPIIGEKSASKYATLFVAAIAIEKLFPGSLLHVYFIPVIILHLLAFFFLSLVCHTKLADSKPKASHLTEFYLIMSFGGALGGFANSIIAPYLLTIPIEYPIMILLAVVFCNSYSDNNSFKALKAELTKSPQNLLLNTNGIITLLTVMIAAMCLSLEANQVSLSLAFIVLFLLVFISTNRWPFMTAVTIILTLTIVTKINTTPLGDIIHRERNFFGIVKVVQAEHRNFIMHGTTSHGEQITVPEYRLKQTSYYSITSSISDAFSILDQSQGPQNVAILGLGAGVTACYSAPERHFDFYEIDQAIIDVAEDPNTFTFLSDCGSPYTTILGDARIKISEQPDKKYDLIITDAFSSDNIPVHMITLEAFEIYMKKLKPEGVLIVHISNRHLDLEPVITAISRKLDIPSYSKFSKAQKIQGMDIDIDSNSSHVVVLTKDLAAIEYLKVSGWEESKYKEHVKPWTDKYSHIIGALRMFSHD